MVVLCFGELKGWMGPNYSISTACATSNFCVLNAANHIARGETVSRKIFLLSNFFIRSCLHTLLHLFLYSITQFVKIQVSMQDIMLCGGSDAPVVPIG